MRDNQKGRVYQWEKLVKRVHGEVDLANQRGLTASEADICSSESDTHADTMDAFRPRIKLELKEHMYKIREQAGLHRSPMLTLESRATAWATAFMNIEVVLPDWAQNYYVLTHEMSHIICYEYFGIKAAAHGREFVGIYMHLLERNLKLSKKRMVMLANELNVDFVTNFHPRRRNELYQIAARNK